MIILDWAKEKLAKRLGGWKASVDTHYNIRVYTAKCQVIDSLPLAELAKAKFRETVNTDTIGITGIVPNSTNNNAVPAQQVLSLDDIV